MKWQPAKETAKKVASPKGEKCVVVTTEARENADFSAGLSPSTVAAMISSANNGEIKDQSRISLEIEERNWTVCHAMATRRNAIIGTDWRVTPADETPKAKEIAEALERDLKNAGNGGTLDSLADLICDLSMAILPGISGSEIVWKEGGKGIAGFAQIPTSSLTFKDSVTPKIVTDDNTDGIDIPEAKAIIYKMRRNGNDPIRGGLIRPLAWLHCFQNANTRWKMGFIERFGMPYVIVKVSDGQFKEELEKYKQIASSFGSNGSAVVTSTTQLETVQAANTSADVYFRLDAYIDAMIEKIILGQNASSGQSSGLSGGDAQSAVRDDIRRADCMGIAAAINAQIVAPWFVFNYGDNTDLMPSFEFVFDLEDEKAKNENVRLVVDTCGIAVRGGVLTPCRQLEAHLRDLIGLPAMDSEVIAEWDKTGGVRAPITLAQGVGEQAENPAVMSDAPAQKTAKPNQDTILAEKMAENALKGDSLLAWFGPTRDAILDVMNADPEKFEDELKKLADKPPFGDSKPWEDSQIKTVMEALKK